VSSQPEVELPLDQRQAIFLALVESQDRGMNVATSRTEIARRFSVTENQVKDIEREWLSNQWPPLD
jgi:hypothetical protein